MSKILITGAAGLIGGEVCARLVKAGHEVVAMVRRNPIVRGNDGIEVEGLRTVSGDVTHNLMGLTPEPCDLVIHCAASLEFDAPEEDLRAINIEGTRNALAFAKAAGARFLHISTAYVCGDEEGSIAEEAVPEGRQFTNRYEASKAAAENVVATSGVPFAIARPSIVLGDSTTGVIRDFPSLCNVFRLLARGKVTQLPCIPGSTLNLVPIDHVAAGIVALAENMEAAEGCYFHLVADQPLLATELTDGVARVEHFPDPQMVHPQDYDPTTLRSGERILAERVLRTFGAYFTRDPRFSDTKLRELTGISCALTDSAWLDRLISSAIAAGYLPAPR